MKRVRQAIAVGILAAFVVLLVIFWWLGISLFDLLLIGGLFFCIFAMITLVLSSKHLTRRD